MSLIQPNDIVLFQGDSITDCGRDQSIAAANVLAGLGRGYAMMSAARLLADRPEDNLRFINRGLSGNRIVDLYARWKIDTLQLKPTVINILVGVNDTWHEISRGNGVEPPRYERIYHELLEWTRKDLPNVKLILCEPFTTPNGEVTDKWTDDMSARRRIVRDLGKQFDATFIDFQAVFDAACKLATPQHWTSDGVHPTAAGHALMAQHWLDTINR